MNSYLARGHQRDETEEGFLRAAADVLAGITERKRAEEALRTERSLLRTLIDNLPDAIYVKDRDSHFLVANKWVTSVMGTTPDMALTSTSTRENWRSDSMPMNRRSCKPASR